MISDFVGRVFGWKSPARPPVEVVLSDRDFETLFRHLMKDPDNEQHAFLLARSNEHRHGVRLLVREILLDESDQLLEQGQTIVEAHPARILDVLDRCQAEELSLIVAHSHPFCGRGVRKSGLDVETERELFPWLAEQLPQGLHASLVFGTESVDGHYWDAGEKRRRPVAGLRIVGEHLRTWAATSAHASLVAHPVARFQRQVEAFGQLGQKRLATTRVGIIGCGGTGSALTQQLAYLGVRDFVLVDDDKVEESNLNRLLGAGPEDPGESKVAVLERAVRGVEPQAVVEALQCSVVESVAQESLKGCDVLFGCTDNDGARLTANDLAVRYLIPLLDLGSGISMRDGQLDAAGGQVWTILPDRFCFYCTGAFDIAQARVDLMSEVERRRHQARGYGTDAPAPSVVFLNTLVASLATQEFLNLLVPYKKPGLMLAYNALTGTVEAYQPPSRRPDCPVCARSAHRALGDDRGDLEPFQTPVPLFAGDMEPQLHKS